MTREQITAAPILSTAFNRDLSAYKLFLNEKKEELDALWKEREHCLRNIRVMKQEMEDIENVGAEDEDDGAEQMLEDIRSVGRKWMERMQKSEKVCPLDPISSIYRPTNMLGRNLPKMSKRGTSWLRR
jgi:hypothetical protein